MTFTRSSWAVRRPGFRRSFDALTIVAVAFRAPIGNVRAINESTAA